MTLSWERPPRVIAHRGASDEAPENTLAAFRRAIEIGVQATELDVHLTRDGEVVVVHDETLERTTNGTGNVADLTLAEIRALDAGTWFSPAFRGERVPTLKEVLALTKGRMLVNVELKAWRESHPGRLESAVERVVREADAEDRVYVSSFNPFAIERFHDLAPAIPTGLILLGMPDEEEISFAREHARGMGLYRECATPEVVARLREAGLHAFVWTVNDEAEARHLLDEVGAAGIITDAPRMMAPLAGLPPRTG